ncbi:MAG: energy transducer TonB, partial [Lysobacteraceae bacterium]
LRQIPKDPVVVDIVETLQPTPRETTRSVVPPVATTRNPSAESALVVDNGSEPVVDTVDNDTGPVGESITPIATGPSPMQLEYRLAPAPTYPRRALQQRLTGTVLLQVLVGIDGHPLEVKVAQSSGHRDLDEAARAQVLKRWSFQPASRNGQAVQAIGMVPIQFALQD